MAIDLATGFNIGSKDVIDERQVLTLEQMKNLDETIYPDKYFAICKDNGKLYIFNASNEINDETGKFRLLSGGTGGGDTTYVLPPATDTTLGGVKVDNITITVDSEGIITAINSYTKTEVDDLLNNKLDKPTVDGTAGQILVLQDDGSLAYADNVGGGTADLTEINDKLVELENAHKLFCSIEEINKVKGTNISLVVGEDNTQKIMNVLQPNEVFANWFNNESAYDRFGINSNIGTRINIISIQKYHDNNGVVIAITNKGKVLSRYLRNNVLSPWDYDNIDLTEINDKLTQLETNQIKKFYVDHINTGGLLYVKISLGNQYNFSKILITDNFGGCLLITGSYLNFGDYKTIKVVRLSNGAYDNHSPNYTFSEMNKIRDVYLDGEYIYVSIGSFVNVYLEGGFNTVETTDSLPTGATELPVLDLTQGSGNDTRITTLETQVSDLFQSVSDGKTLVANAITDKGVSTSTTATFATMATNIGALTSCTASEKQALATAITKKGVSTSSTDSLATMATNIGKIKTNSYKKDYATATCKSNSGTSLTFRFSSTVVGIVKIEPPKSSSSFSIEDDLGISGGTVTIKVLDGYGDWEITAIVYA